MVKNTRKEENAVENPVNDYLRTLKLDRKQSHRNLEVYPLLSDVPLQLAYIVLDEALEDGVIRIEGTPKSL
jgi:hypothetical protein